MKNYNMLRAAPRIELEVVESYNGQNVLLGRCYIGPDECFHTQCDPQWRELFKGNPEMDEGQIFCGVQVVHCKDPLYKAQLAELIPQRTNKEQMDKAFENEIPGLNPSDRSKWSPEGGILAMDESTVPIAYFNRGKMPCSGYSSPAYLAAAEVTMRECKIQVQVLGLRNMCRSLGLNSPSLHLFVQTTEKWDADPAGYKPTKDKSLPSPYEANLKEQLELDVMLPDDAEYAPNLEMVVMDKQGLIFKVDKIMCWGSVELKDFYPHGEKPEAPDEADEEEEDAAAKARREKAEKKRQFESLIGALQRQGTVTAKEYKILIETFKDQQGKDSEIEKAFDLYMSAPSDKEFIQRTEDFLLRAEQKAIQENKKAEEKRQKAAEDKKKKDAAREAEKAKKEAEKQKAAAEKERIKLEKEAARERKEAERAEKKRLKEEAKAAAKAAKEAEREEKRQKKEAEKAAKEEAGAAAAAGEVAAPQGEAQNGADGGGMTTDEEDADAGPADEEEHGGTSPEPGEGPDRGDGSEGDGDGGQRGPGDASDGDDQAAAAGPRDAVVGAAGGAGADVDQVDPDEMGPLELGGGGALPDDGGAPLELEEGDGIGLDEADKGPSGDQEAGQAPGDYSSMPQVDSVAQRDEGALDDADRTVCCLLLAGCMYRVGWLGRLIYIHGRSRAAGIWFWE